MNKEQLIKIFSAYLPYNLEFRSATGKTAYISLDGCYKSEKSTFGNGAIGKSISLNSLLRDFKPVLYDLSYFERYFSKLFDDDLDARTFLNNDFLTIDNQFESLDDMLENYKFEWWPYGVVQLALKHHFNIFGLKEDQFINKATLNK